MDGQNPAPPRKSWNDASPVNTNKRFGFPFFKVVQDFVHPQYVPDLVISEVQSWQWIEIFRCVGTVGTWDARLRPKDICEYSMVLV